MKRILFILAICVAAFMPQANASNDVQTASDEDFVLILPCYDDGGMELLTSIVDKCAVNELDLTSFSQKEYSFMIDFCTQYLMAADDADTTGEGEAFIEATEDEYSLAMSFYTLLLSAENENLLNKDNSTALKMLDLLIDEE